MSDHHGAPGLPNETGINTLGVTITVVLTVMVVPVLMLAVYAMFQIEVARQFEEKIMNAPTTELHEAKAAWSQEAGTAKVSLKDASDLFIVEARVQKEEAIAAAKAAAEEAALNAENELDEESAEGVGVGKNGDVVVPMDGN